MHSSAGQFFRKALKASHKESSRVINLDQNAAYPKAMDDLKAVGMLPDAYELQPVKYLNNSNAPLQPPWGIAGPSIY